MNYIYSIMVLSLFLVASTMEYQDQDKTETALQKAQGKTYYAYRSEK